MVQLCTRLLHLSQALKLGSKFSGCTMDPFKKLMLVLRNHRASHHSHPGRVIFLPFNGGFAIEADRFSLTCMQQGLDGCFDGLIQNKIKTQKILSLHLLPPSSSCRSKATWDEIWSSQAREKSRVRKDLVVLGFGDGA